ncbi:WXG100 family type VII secretion target [Streptomyces sp. NPDC056492]|uniref:WXG100 family type VII secretion target n=1 Tax=unclassified Streptomyces TaxID=2593676 RepID=UPI0036C99114
MSNNLSDGYIYVDYSHMNNASDDMIAQTKAIATTISNLEMELSELRNTWIGEPREIYDGKQQAWDSAVKAMENMLTKHAGLLTEVSGNYKYTDGSLSQMWSSVNIGR